MLSFEIAREGRAIQICCDDTGIDTLVAVLQKLRGSGRHVHLWAPSFGMPSPELNDEGPFGTKAVAEVIITHGGD